MWCCTLCWLEGRREPADVMHGLNLLCLSHLAEVWAEELRQADAEERAE